MPFKHDDHSSSALNKYNELCRYLSSLRHPVAIAFSGGSDSSFLLDAMLKHCRVPVHAVHTVSPFVHPDDRSAADVVADRLNAPVLHLEWNPFNHPEIIRNTERRCYFCKSFMYKNILQHISKLGIALLMDGTQSDDLNSDRPGLQAISELGIITPLAQFGLDKKDIAHLSYLKTLETPAVTANQSCLATRIETGRHITHRELQLVAGVETMLSQMGLKNTRFKIGTGSARIFAPDISRVELEVFFPEIRTIMSDSGFGHLELSAGP